MTPDPLAAARAPAPARRRKILRAGLALLSLGTGLLIAEVALRVSAASANASALDRGRDYAAAPSSDPGAGLANIIRVSDNPRLIYELQPSLAGRTFRDTRVSTDERGFRVSPPVPEDERHLTTIVMLGDSILFGHGVEDDQTFAWRLQEELARLAPARRWRVVNTGVPGYNTTMEVETLSRKVLDLAPDLVVLNVVGNDYAPPYFVRREVDPWRLDRSFLLEAVRSRLDPKRAGWSSAGAGLFEDGRSWYDRDAEGRPEVPEAYSEVFGPEAFRAALDELLALSRQHDFRLLAFTTYEWDKVGEMLAEIRSRGIPHSTLMPTLERHLREERGTGFTVYDYSRSSLVVSRSNKHPSPLQHELAARQLLRDLHRLRLLEPTPHPTSPSAATRGPEPR